MISPMDRSGGHSPVVVRIASSGLPRCGRHRILEAPLIGFGQIGASEGRELVGLDRVPTPRARGWGSAALHKRTAREGVAGRSCRKLPLRIYGAACGGGPQHSYPHLPGSLSASRSLVGASRRCSRFAASPQRLPPPDAQRLIES